MNSIRRPPTPILSLSAFITSSVNLMHRMTDHRISVTPLIETYYSDTSTVRREIAATETLSYFEAIANHISAFIETYAWIFGPNEAMLEEFVQRLHANDVRSLDVPGACGRVSRIGGRRSQYSGPSMSVDEVRTLVVDFRDYLVDAAMLYLEIGSSLQGFVKHLEGIRLMERSIEEFSIHMARLRMERGITDEDMTEEDSDSSD